MIEFPPGLSAVVGPNGCGKSNIVDAIRWVMGEQSARQLRGRKMEDVIFCGASGQQPLGMAEVSLFLENDNGSAPSSIQQFTEVMITRRLYRSGESEYLINNTPCRLKDFMNIFFDSGLSNKNYTIIEQGKVSAVVDMRPDERRMLIEEAAGIAKYKSRKKESLRKLEQSQQNLVRIQDIMGEVQRQLNSLKRQAAKAKRYQKYKQEMRQLDLAKASAHFMEYAAERSEAQKNLEKASRQGDDLQSKLDAFKARQDSVQLAYQEQEDIIKQRYSALYELKENISEKEKEAERISSRLQELERKDASCQNDLARTEVILMNLEKDLKEQNQAREETEGLFTKRKSSLQRMETELEERSLQARAAAEQLEQEKRSLVGLITRETELKNTLTNLEEQKSELERRERSLVSEREEITSSTDEIEYELQTLRSRLEEREEAVAVVKRKSEEAKSELRRLDDQLRELEGPRREKDKELHALKGRLTSLRELWDRRQWLGAGVRAVIESTGGQSSPNSEVLGVVADIIQTERQYEVALETALGMKLEGVLMTDQGCAIKAVSTLASRTDGRCSLIPANLAQSYKKNGHGKTNGAPLLADQVGSPAPYEHLGSYLLGDCLVAADVSEAWNLWEKYGVPVVTLSGEIIDSMGVITGGTEGKNQSRILQKKREIEEAEAAAAACESELQALDAEIAGVRERLSETKNILSALQDQGDSLEEGLLELQQEAFRHEERLRSLSNRSQVLDREIEHLDRQSATMRERKENGLAEIELVAQKKRETEARVEQIDIKAQNMRANLEDEREQLYAVKLEVHKLADQISSIDREIGRLDRSFRDGREHKTRLADQIKEVREERDRLFDREISGKEELESMYEQLNALKVELTSLQEKQDGAQEELNRLSTEVKEQESILAEVRETISQTRLTLKEIELRLQHVVDEARTRYGVDLMRNAEGFSSADMDIEAVDKRLEELQKAIERMGEVNPMAIQEYEALSERDEFLKKQHEDLVGSIQDIHQAIRKINRTCKSKFLETLQAVNENLKKVFPILFNGGMAELVMSEPDQPLESGIEIAVHPPGKKLTTMGLLSGGEKALTALALLFSMYLIKPSPFCLLDEIDAPLDEANIGRFNQLLRRMSRDSQIILITHNRRTMEIVDRLYGVTMERPGVSKLISVNLEEAAAA